MNQKNKGKATATSVPQEEPTDIGTAAEVEQARAQSGPGQSSNVTADYFTAEIEEMIAGMPEEEMIRELESLEQKRAWIAILKYNQIRLRHSQSAVFTGDPFKEPTVLARNQGVMLGLCDLQNAIIILKQEKAEAAREKEERK